MNKGAFLCIVLLTTALAPATAQQFQFTISVSDGVNSLDLTLGVDPNGTDGFDFGLDVVAPPPPPTGAFDARYRIGPEDFLTDIRFNDLAQKTFTMLYQEASGQGPIVLTWDPTVLPAQWTFEIVDDVTGSLFGPLDMTTTNTLDVSTAGGLLDASLRVLVEFNDPPVVITSAGEVAFIEDLGPVVVDGSVTVTDADDAMLVSATVEITNLLDTGQEVLAASPSGVIQAGDISYTAPTLTISPAAPAPIADFEAVLQSVIYDNTSDAPDATDRVLAFAANDGMVSSNVATKTVTVAAVNDAPVVTTSAGPSSFTEDGGPITVDAVVTVIDADDTMLASATVEISNLLDGADEVLTASPSGSILAGDISYAAPTLMINPATPAPVADFQAVLQSVTYDNTGAAPDVTDRVLAFTVSDGTDGSNVGQKTVTITPVNDPPVLSGGPFAAAFVEDISGPVSLAATLTANDLDNTTLSAAQVSITTGFETSQDVLSATASGSIAAGDISYTAATGVLMIAPAGGASVADFEAVLQSVTYDNTAQDPSKAGVALMAGDRTVELIVNDGTDVSNTATSTVSVTATNDAPVVTTSAGQTAFTGGGGPVTVDAAVTVTDLDDVTLVSAAVEITNLLDTGQEALAATPSGAVSASDISYAAPTLTITATAPLSDYLAVLQSVTYDNTSAAPDTTDRVLAFTVSDGIDSSNVAMKTVTVKLVSVPIPIAERWNLLGLPLGVADPHYLSLAPNAIPGTLFGFNGTYFQPDPAVLEMGAGYWLRFPQAETLTIEGIDVAVYPITLSDGWNLISGLSCSLPFSSISDPGGIMMAGTLFGFDGAYYAANTLEAGHGYWVRATAAGPITLDCNASKIMARVQTPSPELDSFSALHISDASGASQTLYFDAQAGAKPSPTLPYSLPPVPPSGSFDARFDGGYSVTEAAEAIIRVQASSYPLTIYATKLPVEENAQYTIRAMQGTDEGTAYTLKEGQRIEISDVSVLKLSREADVPTHFFVDQNYPNPFNPTTTIRYSLAEAAQVQVEVYNVLGQRVEVLVSEQQEAGHHEVAWDGSHATSGVYFYMVRAGNTKAVRKMMLVK